MAREPIDEPEQARGIYVGRARARELDELRRALDDSRGVVGPRRLTPAQLRRLRRPAR